MKHIKVRVRRMRNDVAVVSEDNRATRIRFCNYDFNRYFPDLSRRYGDEAVMTIRATQPKAGHYCCFIRNFWGGFHHGRRGRCGRSFYGIADRWLVKTLPADITSFYVTGKAA